MKTLSFIAIALACLLLQTWFPAVLPAGMGRPDLVFIVAAYSAIRLDVYTGLFACLLLGILTDIFLGISLGFTTVAYLLLFGGFRFLAANIAVDYPANQPLVIGLGLLAVYGLTYLGANLLTPGTIFYPWPWRQVMLSILATAVFTLPLFHCLDRFLLRRGQPEVTS